MKRAISRRPSPALVIACISLFVSLGGVSAGVVTGFIDGREILDNTVRTQDIRDNTVRALDIRNNEVRGTDLRNGTILGRDVADGAISGADVNESRLAQVPDSAALGGVPATGWTRADTTGFALLGPAAGWSIATGEPAPAYNVDPFGYVHLRGVVERGAGPNSPLLTLPAGSRPDTEGRFIVWREGSPLALEIRTDGAVATSTAVSAGERVALDGVVFRGD